MKIGLISDTHGLLRPEAIKALCGVDRIIHAGDIGGPEVIASLAHIARVHAVRGNNDEGPWAESLPSALSLRLAGVRVHILHDVNELDLDPAAAGIQVVIAGHSHRPRVVERDGVLYMNPGSAGPRRFKLPVTIGYLQVEAGSARGELRHIL